MTSVDKNSVTKTRRDLASMYMNTQEAFTNRYNVHGYHIVTLCNAVTITLNEKSV